MIYVHPIVGVLAVVFMYAAALHGFKARRRPPVGPRSRRLHRFTAPAALVAVVFSAAWGSTSIVLFRPKLELADSDHFGVGWLAALLAVLAALTRPRAGRPPWMKAVHPWLGLAALAAATLEAGLGLDMLP